MIRNDTKWPAAALIMILLLAGCALPSQGMDVSGKYIYEKDGCGGTFTIDINDDGTFSYYEGGLSSYIGNGEWELNGDTLILQDEISKYSSSVNCFKVDGSGLVFLSENSSNFMYINVSDGDRFLKSISERPSE